MAGPWLLVIDWLGRPKTANWAHTAHYRTVSADRKQWREAGCQAARIGKVPPLTRIAVTVQARYSGGQLTDPDAVAPAVKGVIDGLVDAGVIPDDTGREVASIRYLAPRIERGSPHALIVHIEEQTEPVAPAPETLEKNR